LTHATNQVLREIHTATKCYSFCQNKKKTKNKYYSCNNSSVVHAVYQSVTHFVNKKKNKCYSCNNPNVM